MAGIPYFITFEGLDGCGKSTQLRFFADRLRDLGIATTTTQEPGGTRVGGAIREVFMGLDGEIDGVVELLLLFAARRQNLREVIDPALAEGATVLCDRFTDSTIAYQGYGRGIERGKIDAIDRAVTGGRRPDLTVLLDLSPEAARQRGLDRRDGAKVDRIDREELAFYNAVRQGFLNLAAAEPERFIVVRSEGAKEETAAEIWSCLSARFEVTPEATLS